MAQLAKVIAVHAGPGWTASTYVDSMDVEACACHPSTEEAAAGEPVGLAKSA